MLLESGIRIKSEQKIRNKLIPIIGPRLECLEEDPLTVLQDNHELNAVREADVKSVFGWLMFGLSLSIMMFTIYESGFLYYITRGHF